jgi:hypothetical protein
MATVLTTCASGGILVLATGRLSPKLMLIPARIHLPRGVQVVAAFPPMAVPAAAADGPVRTILSCLRLLYLRLPLLAPFILC